MAKRIDSNLREEDGMASLPGGVEMIWEKGTFAKFMDPELRTR